jgi:hypothetical protein
MAKAKTKKRFNLFGKSFRLWQLGLIVIAVLFVGFVVYESYLDQKDRQKFDEIEYTIDTLTSRLENEFGISGKYDNYCYESSEKFTTGPTICKYQKKYTSVEDTHGDYNAFLVAQEDLVGWSRNFSSTLLDFASPAGNYSCSSDYDKRDGYSELIVECSTVARESYYEFRD